MSNIFQNMVSFEIADVPMDEAQTVELGVTESDRKFYPDRLLILCDEAPSLIGASSVSVGTNGSSYNNIAQSLLSTLVAADKLLKVDVPAAPLNATPGNTAIKAKITPVLASGGKMRLILVGFYGDYEI